MPRKDREVREFKDKLEDKIEELKKKRGK